MKTMRKLFRVLLALAMTLALAVPAFAAETTGSITITNPQGDHTYTAYKIFDVTYSGDNYSYTISDTDTAFNTVKAYADVAANGLNLTAVADTGKYNVSSSAGFSAASFAQYLKTKADSLGTGTAFIEDGNTMKASGPCPGLLLCIQHQRHCLRAGYCQGYSDSRQERSAGDQKGCG